MCVYRASVWSAIFHLWDWLAQPRVAAEPQLDGLDNYPGCIRQESAVCSLHRRSAWTVALPALWLHCTHTLRPPALLVSEIIRADYDAIQAAIEVDDAAAAGVSRSTVEAAVNARRVAHGNIAARADAGGGSVANIHAPKSSAHAHDYDLALNARFAAGRLVGSSFVNTVFAQVTMRVACWQCVRSVG